MSESLPSKPATWLQRRVEQARGFLVVPVATGDRGDAPSDRTAAFGTLLLVWARMMVIGGVVLTAVALVVWGIGALAAVW